MQSEATTIYNIFDLGYDRNLSKDDAFYAEISRMKSVFDGVNPANISSGYLTSQLTMVSGNMQSSNFVSGSAGWRFTYDGDLEANSGVFRSELAVGTDPLWFKVDGNGNVWSGKSTLALAKISGFAVTNDGVGYFTAAIITGATVDGTTTLGGRAASVVASAIDSSGHFIDANLNTSAKTILGSFTFGVSGAIAIKTDDDNGIWISPTGILAKKSGSNTFSLEIDGDAIFSGTLSSASGTFGTITAGTISGVSISGATITGSTLTTGTTGNNVDITAGRIKQRTGTTEVMYTDVGTYGGWLGFKDTSGVNKCSIYVRDASSNISFVLDSGSLYMQAVNIYLVVGAGSIAPTSDNEALLGGNSTAFDTVYSYNYVDKCSIYDELDDIGIIKKIKPKKGEFDEYGYPKMDLNALPVFLKVENGNPDQTFRNLGRIVDLCLGAIKQLDEKIESLKKLK